MSTDGRAAPLPRRVALAPLATALIWGVNIPVMKGALETLHPFAFNALRLTLSAAALAVLARREPRIVDRKGVPWTRVVLVGLLGSLVYQLLFLAGMARTAAGHTALIIASQPLWTACLASAVGLERRGRTAWIGFGVAFVGTALVVTRGGDVAGATVAGNLLVLAAAICWACSTVLSRPLLDHLPPTRLALAFTLVSLPFHWALATGHLGPLTDGTFGRSGWAAVLYSGVFSTGVAYALWNVGVRALGPGRTAIFANLVPVVALLVAWATLGEVPAPLQVAGGALVLTGLALAQRSRGARPPRG